LDLEEEQLDAMKAASVGVIVRRNNSYFSHGNVVKIREQNFLLTTQHGLSTPAECQKGTFFTKLSSYSEKRDLLLDPLLSFRSSRLDQFDISLIAINDEETKEKSFLPITISFSKVEAGDDVCMFSWINELSSKPSKIQKRGKITGTSNGFIFHNIPVANGNSGNGIFLLSGPFIGTHIGYKDNDVKQGIALSCVSVWNWLDKDQLDNYAIKMDIEIDWQEMQFILAKDTTEPYRSRDLDFYLDPISKLPTKLSIRGDDYKNTIISVPKEFQLRFPEYPKLIIRSGESCELPTDRDVIVLQVFGPV